MGWKKLFLKVIKEDFLGHPVVKILPSKAGDAGSDWGTKIPQAVGQLSPGATTKACAPQLQRAHVLQWRAHVRTQLSQNNFFFKGH